MKDLEKESDQLKKIVADQLLQIEALEIALEKKRLSPERQRRVAAKVVTALKCSGRQVCRWLGIPRSTYRYRRQLLPEKQRLLEMEIVKLSHKDPCFGYRKITQKLRNEGWDVSKKLVQRVRREEHLQVPPPKPCTRRQGLSTGLPTQADRRNQRCGAGTS